MAFPVVFTKTEGGSEEEGKWELVPYKLLKELKQACHDYGSAATAAKSLQSYLTLCDPIDGSPPGSPVLGILQARVLEWAA